MTQDHVMAAAFELIVGELLEWKLVFLAVPTLIIAWLICKFLFLDAFMSPLRNLPGPPPSRMFLGNLLELKRKGFLDGTLEWSKKYGGIFVMWLRPGMLLIMWSDKCNQMQSHVRHTLLISSIFWHDLLLLVRLSLEIKPNGSFAQLFCTCCM